MSILRITKENGLNIPIGTQLHAASFFDRPKNDDSNTWDSVVVYLWEDPTGIVHAIKQHKIADIYEECCVNVIILSNLKFAIKGEEYWKVFAQKTEARFHKLENSGKGEAVCFKPYKDVVNSNTNSFGYASLGVHRFKTEEEALEYISRVDKKYKEEQL